MDKTGTFKVQRQSSWHNKFPTWVDIQEPPYNPGRGTVWFERKEDALSIAHHQSSQWTTRVVDESGFIIRTYQKEPKDEGTPNS